MSGAIFGEHRDLGVRLWMTMIEFLFRSMGKHICRIGDNIVTRLSSDTSTYNFEKIFRHNGSPWF